LVICKWLKDVIINIFKETEKYSEELFVLMDQLSEKVGEDIIHPI